MDLESLMRYKISGGCKNNGRVKGRDASLNTFNNYRRFIASEHEILNDTHDRMKYKKIKNQGIVHSGQMKLYLTCIQYLTKYWDPCKYKNPKLVYVGAAPCNWATLITKLFPLFELHLYDPEKFNIEVKEKSKDPDSKIVLYERLFEDEDAEKWSKVDEVFFVSDIRLFSYDIEGDESEQDVHECMIRQQRWVQKINPIAAQLKFKLPYNSDKIKLSKEDGMSEETIKNDKYVYLRGTIYFQQWVGALSTESRLVSIRPHTLTDYNFRTYEDMMFSHNVKTRGESVKFMNMFNGNPQPYTELPKVGLYNDWDSTMTIHIIKEYLGTGQKIVTENDVFNFFIVLDEGLNRIGALQRESMGLPPKSLKLIDRR